MEPDPDLATEILASLARLEEMLQRLVEASQQTPFAERRAAYVRSTRGELRGGG